MAVKKVFVRAGETLFEEGDKADSAYLIELGSIGIIAGRGPMRRVLAVLGSGDIVGEMAIIDGLPRSATAKALGDAVLTEVSRETLIERMEQGDDIIVHLLWVVISRLRASNSLVPLDIELPRLSGKVLDELMTDQAIRDASHHKEFVPHLQPIVRLRDLEVVGYEALARWHTKDGAVHAPTAFLPIAERTNAVKGIDICILLGACEAIGRINRLRKGIGLGPVHVSVNIAGTHFLNSEIVSIVESTLSRCGIPADYLSIEVTEAALLANQVEATIALNKFRDLGVGIYLDDFGTGYSNLGCLNRLPIDRVKIDKSFVSDDDDEGHGAKICAAIIALAKSMRKETVAEGIETAEQAMSMIEMGCDYGQGYFFGIPVEEKIIAETLRHISGRGGAPSSLSPATSAARARVAGVTPMDVVTAK